MTSSAKLFWITKYTCSKPYNNNRCVNFQCKYCLGVCVCVWAKEKRSDEWRRHVRITIKLHNGKNGPEIKESFLLWFIWHDLTFNIFMDRFIFIFAPPVANTSLQLIAIWFNILLRFDRTVERFNYIRLASASLAVVVRLNIQFSYYYYYYFIFIATRTHLILWLNRRSSSNGSQFSIEHTQTCCFFTDMFSSSFFSLSKIEYRIVFTVFFSLSKITFYCLSFWYIFGCCVFFRLMRHRCRDTFAIQAHASPHRQYLFPGMTDLLSN